MQSCVSMQIFIHGLVPVKLRNLFTKNKIFEIVKMESLAGAGGWLENGSNKGSICE